MGSMYTTSLTWKLVRAVREARTYNSTIRPPGSNWIPWQQATELRTQCGPPLRHDSGSFVTKHVFKKTAAQTCKRQQFDNDDFDILFFRWQAPTPAHILNHLVAKSHLTIPKIFKGFTSRVDRIWDAASAYIFSCKFLNFKIRLWNF